MNEDDSSSERCPICDKKECQKHLLARFDASGDEGEYGVGLVGGPLYYEYEIDEVLNRARLAWVQSVRASGKPKAPRWITNERGLKDYFNHLGPINLSNYESDEEAASDLPPATDFEWEHAREDFLWEVLSEYGYLRRTEQELEAPLRSTTYLNWWTFKPRTVVKKLRARLRSILLKAGVKLTKRKSWAAKSSEDSERTAKAAVRFMRETAGVDASKPPKRTAKLVGDKRSGHERASKRRSMHRR